MAKRGIGSYHIEHPSKDATEVEFGFVTQNGTALLIDTGRTEPNPLTNIQQRVTVWLPMSLINNVRPDLSVVKRGELLRFEIPEWLAYEKDLI